MLHLQNEVSYFVFLFPPKLLPLFCFYCVCFGKIVKNRKYKIGAIDLKSEGESEGL